MGRNDKGNVGFIGIGTMGRQMVRNLLVAGHAVRVFDLNEAALADSVKEGAAGANSPADAAQGADIVITMLPDTPHVEATVYGEHGLLKSPPPGKLIVDMSTISPVAVRRMHADMQKVGVSFIDAPVSVDRWAPRTPRSRSWRAVMRPLSPRPNRSSARWARPSRMSARPAPVRP